MTEPGLEAGPEPETMPRETIFAPASGAGVAGIAVIRVSGPATDAALLRLAGAPLTALRRAVLRDLRDDAGGLIDQLAGGVPQIAQHGATRRRQWLASQS